MAGKNKRSMELLFTRGSSRSERTKVEEFWKFLDATNNISPCTAQSVRKSSEKEVGKTSKSKTSKSKKDKVEENATWCNKLKAFQELGLDRAALVADNSCGFCLAESTRRPSDFADTVRESYEELDNEMRAFDKRSQQNKT